MISRLFPIMTLVVVVVFTQDAAASELDSKLRTLADLVLKVTKGQGVTVGEFSQTGVKDSNSGPRIEAALRAALESLSEGIVQDDAKFEIKGDYAFAKSRDPRHRGLKVVKITARIIDNEFSEELASSRIQVKLDHTQSIAAILQPTVHLESDQNKPGGTKAERNRDIGIGLDNPQVHIHGTRSTLVSSRPKSEYAVELLVKPLKNHEKQEAQPRRVVEANGQAFVGIDRDELYEVKLYNNSDAEVAARLSVDGLDMFHFSNDRNPDGSPRFTHTIIPPHDTATIVGWHKSLEGSNNYLSFLITGYGQGAVSEAKAARGNIGVIHVQFAFCHALTDGAQKRSAGNETGFGPPREVRQKAVRYEIEPPHDFVGIRYTR